MSCLPSLLRLLAFPIFSLFGPLDGVNGIRESISFALSFPPSELKVVYHSFGTFHFRIKVEKLLMCVADDVTMIWTLSVARDPVPSLPVLVCFDSNVFAMLDDLFSGSNVCDQVVNLSLDLRKISE
ncbi:hypothetical protein Slin15195_G083830 [Septoria linicola]|uniref:Secreted protein n=1 Tax=Septoria linicola TaxID=215465 RepID=A0A9Q9EM44_9PEZI|nr:hypothetical protein Slin14017_G086340 [Septoria linicola]USW55064.1 hypothetical protein Slin15195_G083830 [Septoria linicola]